jgi:membrane-associated phospholipid phosphatase
MNDKVKTIGKGFLIYISFLLVFGATIHTGILAKIGFAGNYGIAALASFFLTLALVDRHWALPTIAWVLTVLANSTTMAERFHYDLDVMAAALIGVVTLPYVIKLMDN